MAPPPDGVAQGNGQAGVFVSLTDIYMEQMSQRLTLRDVVSKTDDLAGDMTEVREEIKAIKARQWPLSTLAVVATVAGSIAGFVALIVK